MLFKNTNPVVMCYIAIKKNTIPQDYFFFGYLINFSKGKYSKSLKINLPHVVPYEQQEERDWRSKMHHRNYVNPLCAPFLTLNISKFRAHLKHGEREES